MNYCFNKNNSCNACCGIYNLDYDSDQLRDWLDENTRIFLATDLTEAKNLVNYRREREESISGHIINKETYVCPFVGYVEETRSGCLLHPKGSPHPQISLWDHPQNFSFYGESICLSYDCQGKENHLLDLLPRAPVKELYAFFTANHGLLRAFDRVAGLPAVDRQKLMKLIESFLKKEKVPVTSFEIYSPLDDDPALCWGRLGSYLDRNAYNYDRVEITPRGLRRGRLLQKLSHIF